MNKNATDFIGRISQALDRSSPPENIPELILPNSVQNEYLDGASGEVLRNTFIQNAEAMATKVYTTTLEELNTTLREAVDAFPDGSLILSDESFWSDQGTPQALLESGREVFTWSTDTDREQNIKRSESASIGIAVAKLALAETGTVMVYSHMGCGRAVTLLPTTTIFIVKARDIVPRLTQAMRSLRQLHTEDLPSSVNFISAASATADIELVRVQGVHGPLEIAYIVVE